MALHDFLADLDALLAEATAAFAAAGDDKALEAARIHFIGAKSGKLKTVQKGLGQVDKADKPAAGLRFNEVKQQIETAFEGAKERLRVESPESRVQSTPLSTLDSRPLTLDPTVPGTRPRLGRLHPITQTIEELKEIMGRLGFSVADGPEVEDPWHNFEALNIPPEHPARDPLENFYLSRGSRVESQESLESRVESREPNSVAALRGLSTLDSRLSTLLLRSQTSTVQIRVMEKQPPPVRIISCGRVYRPDTADATHYPMFHQIEGLLIDRGVTMVDLKSTLRLFARSAFADDVHIRFRPSFFPFTEPSVEVDMSWQGGWIEMGGAGMVDPNVLRAVGYDPEDVTGFAFGLGIERICARRHGVTDIREFYKNDVRFLHQF
jgi:phenylalanyl-tRNA synthetase alpha chain